MSESISTENRFNNLNALLRVMLMSLRGYWTQAENYQKFVYIISALLIASGVFHMGIFLLVDEPWAGPVSWRKPIVFGFSFGITNLILAWIMTFLPRHRVSSWLLMGTLGIASLVEVFLITMQKWRGVPSHFNNETPFDQAVFGGMGIMIAFVGLVIVVLMLWSFFSLKTTPSMAWAIRIGLILLVFGQVFGILLIVNGVQTTNYATASIFSEPGQLKVPHAVSLHALQLLPVLAWLLLFTNWPESRRTKAVVLAAAGYVGIVVLSALQTFSGLSHIDLNLLTALLLGISVIGISSAYIAAIRALRQTLLLTGSQAA
ncbi:MAG: hypothetical protein IH852_01350 [Bacteroidetes bacterium]|nr:hypothetical protein [Bacteroidota bacterium]